MTPRGPVDWTSQVAGEVLAHRSEIDALGTRYLDALDGGDVEGFVRVFTDDCALRLVQGAEREVFEGSAGARRFVEQHGRAAFHTTSDRWLAVDGDTAVGRSRWTAYSSALRDDGTLVVQWVGHYRDELVRTAEGWRLASRDIVVFGGREAQG